MSAVKEIVEEILEQLPDDTSLEEVQYRLFVRQKIEQGLADVETGRVISHDEAKRQIVPVLVERDLSDPNNDASFWRSRPAEERIAALEEFRAEYHHWLGDAESRLQRVFTVVEQ